MTQSLRGFQQDPDNGEANHGAAGVAHKDFIAAAKEAEIKQNIGQRGGDHRETPYGQAVLTVEAENNAHRRKGDR